MGDKEEFKQEVERHRTEKETEPGEIIRVSEIHLFSS